MITNLKVYDNQYITFGMFALLILILLKLGKKYFNGPMCSIQKDLTGQVVIITGANAGIGKETARALARMGATTILACRDEKKTVQVVEELKTQTKNSNIEFIRLDLSDLKSIQQFAKEFKAKYSKLNILINNAGVMAIPDRRLTKDGFEMQFGTNHLGHFYLTKLLLDTLKASAPSRVINVSAKAQLRGKMNWDDLMFTNNYSGIAVYAQSKLANVMFTKELQRRLNAEKANVKAISLHPGVIVTTELGRYMLERPIAKIAYFFIAPIIKYLSKSIVHGAQTTLYCTLEDQNSLEGGSYYSDGKSAKINPLVSDEKNCQRLWQISEDLISKKL